MLVSFVELELVDGIMAKKSNKKASAGKKTSKSKSLTGVSNIPKNKRQVQKRMASKKLATLIDLKESLINGNWKVRGERTNNRRRKQYLNMVNWKIKRERSNAVKRKNSSFFAIWKNESHRYRNHNVHSSGLLVEQNGGEVDIGTQQAIETNVIFVENDVAAKPAIEIVENHVSDVKNASPAIEAVENVVVLEPPTPDAIDSKRGVSAKDKSDSDCVTDIHKLKSSNGGDSESLIDMLKKRSGVAETKTPKRTKTKKHRPKVFHRNTDGSALKPRTPSMTKPMKRSAKVKRKLDFADKDEKLDHEEPKAHQEEELNSTNGSLPESQQVNTNSQEELASHEETSQLMSRLESSKTVREKLLPHVLDLNPEDEAFSEALADFAAEMMASLRIDDGESKQIVVRGLSSSGAIVQSKRKRKKEHSKYIRTAIDLDEETMRVWNLLMENKWSESAEAEGANDPKYMKSERELYRGKIDMFLARMHKIQGDRSFSPWKGSVVDSIVGVFLTQNVSDNLSSNAFMELASAYPPLSLSEQNSQFNCENRLPAICGAPSDENGSSSVQPETPRSISSKSSKVPINWDELRIKYSDAGSRIRTDRNADSVNWGKIRETSLREVADVIAHRGMNNQLAGRIKNFLDRLVKDHGSIDLEWLRNVPPEKAKDFMLSISGLGLKSTECVRLLSLHFPSFPVDTNAGRFFVRVGWVPLKPLPDGVKLHDLNEYPPLDSVQKYMWPRICDWDVAKLYDFHCHSITFSKSFCTKSQPNCKQCPMRDYCRHYSSAQRSEKLHIQDSESKENVSNSLAMLASSDGDETKEKNIHSEPIIEFPSSPESSDPLGGDIAESSAPLGGDIEDFEIPTIKLNGEFSDDRALATIFSEFAMPPQKISLRLRAEHLVYELPDSHPLLCEYEPREPEDRCPYLLAIWNTDDTASTAQDLVGSSSEVVPFHKDGMVKGTILIPCRTANRGRFPLNGTYFQNNEVFADHEGSVQPIDVPREWIWSLPMHILYCGTSITSICRGMDLGNVMCCFRGFICIRGFSRNTRRPRILQNKFYICKTRKVEEH